MTTSRGINELSLISDVLNWGVGVYNDTALNGINSFFASIPEAILHHGTFTDLRVLNNDYSIDAPDATYQSTHSPTAAQFMDAANASYTVAGTPDNLTPFEIDGRQAEIVNQASGLAARAWETTDTHQVIISYSGTVGGDNIVTNPQQVIGQVLADIPSVAGQTSEAQQDAVKFAQYVNHAAGEQGISSNDVFVTGHSLGGGEAEYVAQQTGLGGIAFDGTGIPTSDTAVGDGSNFISFDTYGDVWGGYASDVEGVQPIAPEYDADGGDLAHWGNLIMIGDVQDQQDLNTALNSLSPLSDSSIGLLANFLQYSSAFHYPGNQAEDLGIDLSTFSLTQDLGAEGHGTPFEIAELGLADILEANELRTDYHDTALPESLPDNLDAALPADVTGAASANDIDQGAGLVA